jgi:hypothetical protein
MEVWLSCDIEEVPALLHREHQAVMLQTMLGPAAQ